MVSIFSTCGMDEISVSKALMPIKYSVGKEWLFPSSRVWIAIDISKWTGFCVGTFFTEGNMAPILFTSSLCGYYKLDVHTIYLQQFKSGHQITVYLTSHNFVSSK